MGVAFCACRAVYPARGWIKSLTMGDAGPQTFSLYFSETLIASTTTGTIAWEHVSESGKQYMRDHTQPTDVLRHLIDAEYMNMTFPARVIIVAEEPPTRQHYYVQQEWAQAFQFRDGKEPSQSQNDMDLAELPCLLAYNLRSDDRTATIRSTRPLEQPSQE